MITVKSVIKKSLMNDDGKVNIKIRITQNRDYRLIATEHYIDPKFFDSVSGRVKKKHPYSEYINTELDKLELEFRHKLLNIDNRHSFDISTLSEILKVKKNDFDFNVYSHFDTIISEFENKKSNTFIVYKTAKNNLKKFKKGEYLDIRNIDLKFLRDFTAFYLSKGKSENGISVDLRSLRAVFNRLIDDNKLSLEYYPFRRFKIEQRETVRRSLTIEKLKIIKRIATASDANGIKPPTGGGKSPWEIAYSHLHNRLGIDLPYTKQMIIETRSKNAAHWVSKWETLAHGSQLHVSKGTTYVPRDLRIDPTLNSCDDKGSYNIVYPNPSKKNFFI